MFRVKNNKRMVNFSVVLFCLVSIFFLTPQSILVSSEILLPEISPPDIDGSLTSTQTEWVESVKFDLTLNGQAANAFVGVTKENIYFGVNFTQSQYIPLNTTIPTSATNFDPALNRSHDFFAIQIDRNFDQATFGTSSSFDDVIVFNQYEANKSRDGYANGSIGSDPILFDTDAGGSDDGSANVGIVDGVNDQVSYEFEKPLFSNDSKGGDFNLQDSRGIQFRFLSWFDRFANASYSESVGSQWFTFRINETGTGFAEAKAGNLTTINLDVSGFSGNNSATIFTLLNFTDYNIVSSDGAPSFFTNYSNTYALFVGENGWSTSQIENLWRFTSLGGKAIIVLSGDNENSRQASRDIVNQLSLAFEPNVLLDGTTETITVNANHFNSVPFLSNNSVVTDEKVEAIKVKSWALNTTTQDKTGSLLSQNYKMYDLVNLEDSIVYDVNGNNSKDSDDLPNTNLSISTGFDFQYGGRVLITTFNPLTSDSFMEADNLPFFYRALSWVTKETHALVGRNLTVSSRDIIQNDSINLKVTVVDLFNTYRTDARVFAELTRVGQYQSLVNLSYEQDGLYEVDFQIDTFGFQEITITSFADWYGFYEFEKINIFAERRYLGFNLDKNIFLLFFGSVIPIALLVIGYIYLKRYILKKS